MSSAIQTDLSETGAASLAAIVLSAGYSSRMGEFKPLLPLAGVTALEQCITLFRDAGLSNVIAVLGHREDELRPLAVRCGARPVSNPQFEQGMFSSIVAGMRALPAHVTGAFILPVDMPMVRATTVRQLVACFATHRSGIIYPVFAGHRGHPPLIARSILAEAARDGASGSLRSLLSRHESRAVDLAVADEAIHMDMDTPADYDALFALASCRDIPTVSECEAILANRHVEKTVIRHAHKVAEVAHRVGLALVRTGLILNLELVTAAALLHDLAKGQLNHAAAGACILRDMGFLRVAEIVAAHADLNFTSTLDESAIVFLADKMIRGDKLVTVDERFRTTFSRHGNDPVALKAAQNRKEIALAVALAVETRLKAPLSMVADASFCSTTQPAEALIAREVEA